MQVKQQQLEPDIEQQTGSKMGKENIKAVYSHPAYLTSMQSTSCEMPGWIKQNLESRFLGEISITSTVALQAPVPMGDCTVNNKTVSGKVESSY